MTSRTEGTFTRMLTKDNHDIRVGREIYRLSRLTKTIIIRAEGFYRIKPESRIDGAPEECLR